MPGQRVDRRASRPARRRRRLSRRQVADVVRIYQRWKHLETGVVWVLEEIHRQDRLVLLVRRPAAWRYVPFGELGSQYQLLVEDEG